MLTESSQNEYWYHVASMYEIPIAGEIEAAIDPQSITNLLRQLPSDSEVDKTRLMELIASDPDNIDILRSLIGISDKRMYLDLSYIFYKTPRENSGQVNILGTTFYELNRHPLTFFKGKIKDSNLDLRMRSLQIIAEYLDVRGVIEVINCLKDIGPERSYSLIDRIINEKEAQQQLSKRRGHGAEQALASYLVRMGVQIIPPNKHTDPMARDPSVNKTTFMLEQRKSANSWAFDIVIAEDENPSIFIQSLIHTSDPGQYGVNKSDETVQIKRNLNHANSSDSGIRELWGLVDGVGFSENKSNTIDKMLIEFDQFIQMKTLYKAALRLHSLSLLKIRAIFFSPEVYSFDQARAMFTKYGSPGIEFHHTDQVPQDAILGGGAAVVLSSN
jgi:hypothetical protein